MSQQQRTGADQQRNDAARAEMLRRVRTALHDVPASEQAGPAYAAIPRDYHQQDTTTRAEIVDLFMERVADYKATIRKISAGELVDAIATACEAHGIHRLVVAADIPSEWLPVGATVLRDEVDGWLSYAQLEQSDGVLTGCALGIAQTGTIVLDSGALQGRRVLSLLPDYALCVIHAEQIVGIVPTAVRHLSEAIEVRHAPLTLISGPSATSDIELSRVEGVHGPRTLDVLVVV